MTYRVELTERATRDLRRIFAHIRAAESRQAHAWFNELESVILSLDEHPTRGPTTSEDASLRHLFFGKNRNVYRIIYAIDEHRRLVTVIHLRHAARDVFGSDAEG